MRTLLLLAALAPAVAAAQDAPSCASVTKALYGVALGPMQAQDYPSGLRAGLRREGTAEIIAQVGFDSVEGSADGVAYPRIMVFFDRGRVNGALAIGRIASEKDHGFARMVAAVSAAANSPPKLAGGKASFACEGTIALSVEPTEWDDGPAVKVRAMDETGKKQSSDYIARYCADPSRRRPQDACKR